MYIIFLYFFLRNANGNISSHFLNLSTVQIITGIVTFFEYSLQSFLHTKKINTNLRIPHPHHPRVSQDSTASSSSSLSPSRWDGTSRRRHLQLFTHSQALSIIVPRLSVVCKSKYSKCYTPLGLVLIVFVLSSKISESLSLVFASAPPSTPSPSTVSPSLASPSP